MRVDDGEHRGGGKGRIDSVAAPAHGRGRGRDGGRMGRGHRRGPANRAHWCASLALGVRIRGRTVLADSLASSLIVRTAARR